MTYVVLILSALLLQSCASSVNTQRIQSGKISFMSGDFKSAFHQLLPLAAEGIPQAEYSVGYMYYYGYGVTQDSESGIFWMNKAAATHYAPAIQALAAIQENAIAQEKANHIYYESTPPQTNNPSTSKQGHVILMPSTDKPIPEKINPETPKKTTLDTKTKTSINSTDKKYTLQLFGDYSLATVKKQQQLVRLGSTSIAQTKHNGRDWYVLIYGKYPAISAAELAKLDLPKKEKDLKPWVRKLNELNPVL